jgi:HPt (histidine-containing phosphotransfer) domain-containing protein
LQKGFQAFLTKPIDIIQMDAAINHWVRDKKLEKELESKMPENAELLGPSALPMSDPTTNPPALPSIEALALPSIEALIKAGTRIKGLDIQAGLERLNGDRHTWLEVIRTFVNTSPELLEILKDQTKENLSKYSVTVHGIKSVCYSFGAKDAGDKAKALEEKSLAMDLTFVQEHSSDFINIIEELIQGLKELLEAVSDKTEKPLKDMPDPEVLEKILEAAKNYDIRNLEEGIAVLEKYTYQEDPELVPWLRRQCEDLEFTAIEARLAKT